MRESSPAYYIKLGRGGEWEIDSIASGKLRLGWKGQSLEDISLRRWTKIEEQLRANDGGKRIGATTSDINALKLLANCDDSAIWITFHKSTLWWTRLAKGEIEEDSTSKFRRTAIPWSNKDANDKLLAVNSLPGKITLLQGFRATLCRVKETELLGRVLRGERSEIATDISEQRESLSRILAEAIKELHWKDFETLVDLIFRDAGWIRVSILGQQEKGFDLELREPVLQDRYVVQVKSRAGSSDLQNTIDKFSPSEFRKIFFVVHTPDDTLTQLEAPSYVEFIFPKRLGAMAMNAGLVEWIEEKVV